MMLLARNLLLGFAGMMLASRGVSGQIRVGVARSNLRAPLTVPQTAGEPQSGVEDELQQMSTQAGMIFAGQVVSVRPQGDAAGGTGWVEVQFRVDEAVRGCAAGATYRLREWAGLWAGGIERYRVGQQLLMMLHAAGPSGLSSPVDGQDGAIPIIGSSAAPGPKDAFVGSSEEAVDLRWIQTRVLRSPTNGDGLHGRPVRPVEPVYVGQEPSPMGVQEKKSESIDGPTLSINPPAASATLHDVLAMLGAWEAQKDNAVR